MRTTHASVSGRRRKGIALVAAAALASTLLSSAVAVAQEATNSWSMLYETAHRDLVEGRYDLARSEFAALASTAPNEAERRLALEMVRIAANWAAGARAQEAPQPPPAPASTARPPRTRDEITLLYATSFLYGAGTGSWFLLQTQPDSALTATLPFAGITAAPVITLAIIDGNKPLPYATPHAIAEGMYIGLGESMLLVGYEHARADRLYGAQADSHRWQPEDVATVLWTGATLGGIAGGTLSAGLPTTPGRVSYTGSFALWGGLLTGFTVGAIIPETPHRTEHSLLGAGIGYNAGILGGMMTASTVSPSVTRMRLVDLSGVAGAFATGGTYLALARGGDPRAAMSITAAGAATGLGVGWFATQGMTSDRPTTARAPHLDIQPTISPVAGGGVIGVTGVMQ